MNNIRFGHINVIESLKQEGWSEKSFTLIFNLLISTVFMFALIEIKDFPQRAVAYPLVASIIGLVFSLLSFFGDLKNVGEVSKKQEDISTASIDQMDIASDRSIPPRMVYIRGAKFLAWFIGYYLAILLLGLMLSSTILCLLYIHIFGKARWWQNAVITLITIYLLFGIVATTFGVTWPTGIFNILADPLPVPWFD